MEKRWKIVLGTYAFVLVGMAPIGAATGKPLVALIATVVLGSVALLWTLRPLPAAHRDNEQL